jgi:hypothetical protein
MGDRMLDILLAMSFGLKAIIADMGVNYQITNIYLKKACKNSNNIANTYVFLEKKIDY